ncbi:hypothetical protein DICVIV_07297 [Dictyocaulus viviparus]|uniref:Thiolase N-terminal domain-containing protein n=1 Tax=Dictyocaulus viviparus TaxID=29172 RepID=A0A0D8XPR4_DICVI|nr:hypothetical protein DICVIV_07297 [Dictyocaulus viviparus]
MLLTIENLILLTVLQTNTLKLGLIDDDVDLQRICQAAIDKAKQNSVCAQDPIEIIGRIGCVSNYPSRGTSMAAELFYKQQVCRILQAFLFNNPIK